MKFDYAIGNPPYNNQQCDTSNLQTPVYHIFIEESFKVAKCTELITPARFLFNTGLTPKNWNKKMLNDENFKVLEYEENADNIFPNTEIKGGVAIHIRDENKVYGAIKEFIPYPELESIIAKVYDKNTLFLDEIVSPLGIYKLTDEFFKDYPDANRRLKKDGNIINTNFYEKIPEANTKIGERERER
ncbi:MAG: Eco57I restriction-modification methylase domain-containing protein [Methanosphaera sp.]|nr:Eco57I restriction-modification methylase domain-containing protein [Methanosphaera sp.]